MLNVRDESKRAVLANEEIKNLVQILGLKLVIQIMVFMIQI